MGFSGRYKFKGPTLGADKTPKVVPKPPESNCEYDCPDENPVQGVAPFQSPSLESKKWTKNISMPIPPWLSTETRHLSAPREMSLLETQTLSGKLRAKAPFQYTEASVGELNDATSTANIHNIGCSVIGEEGQPEHPITGYGLPTRRPSNNCPVGWKPGADEGWCYEPENKILRCSYGTNKKYSRRCAREGGSACPKGWKLGGSSGWCYERRHKSEKFDKDERFRCSFGTFAKYPKACFPNEAIGAAVPSKKIGNVSNNCNEVMTQLRLEIMTDDEVIECTGRTRAQLLADTQHINLRHIRDDDESDKLIGTTALYRHDRESMRKHIGHLARKHFTNPGPYRTAEEVIKYLDPIQDAALLEVQDTVTASKRSLIRSRNKARLSKGFPFPLSPDLGEREAYKQPIFFMSPYSGMTPDQKVAMKEREQHEVHKLAVREIMADEESATKAANKMMQDGGPLPGGVWDDGALQGEGSPIDPDEHDANPNIIAAKAETAKKKKIANAEAAKKDANKVMALKKDGASNEKEHWALVHRVAAAKHARKGIESVGCIVFAKACTKEPNDMTDDEAVVCTGRHKNGVVPGASYVKCTLVHENDDTTKTERTNGK
jgi:hypothetical protein